MRRKSKSGKPDDREWTTKEYYVAMWPIRAKSKLEYDIVPVSSVVDLDPKAPVRTEPYKYKVPGATRSTLGQFLISGATKNEVKNALSGSGGRIRFPSRRNIDLNATASSSDEGSKCAMANKRKNNANLFLTRKKGAELNTSHILQQYSQVTLDELNAVPPASASPGTSSSTHADPPFKDPADPTSLGSGAAESLVTDVLSKDDDPKEVHPSHATVIACKPCIPSSNSQPAMVSTGEYQKIRFAAATNDNSINVESALLQIRKIQKDIYMKEERTGALAKKAEEDFRKAKEILEEALKERQLLSEEWKKIEAERLNIEESRKAAVKALNEAVIESASKLDNQRVKIVGEMNQKILEFKGVTSSGSSGGSSHSSSSHATPSPPLIQSPQSHAVANTDADLNKMINIGEGVKVFSYYWELGKGAQSRREWSLYAVKAAFGEDAKYYRATTPRSKDYNFKTFPVDVVRILQKHYRLFLLAHRNIMWAPNPKRKQKKTGDAEQSDSEEHVEEAQAKEYTPEEVKARVKVLVQGLSGQLADKCTELWRRWLRSTKGTTLLSKKSAPQIDIENESQENEGYKSPKSNYKETNKETESDSGEEDDQRNDSDSDDTLMSGSHHSSALQSPRRAWSMSPTDLSPESRKYLYTRCNNGLPIQDLCLNEQFHPLRGSTQANQSCADESDGERDVSRLECGQGFWETEN